MARFIGDQTQTSIRFESGTYANPSGAADTGEWLGMVQNCNITEEVGRISARYNEGGTRNVQQKFDTVVRARAAVTFWPQDFRSLTYALGSCVDASGTAAGLTHTFSETNSDNTNAFTSGLDAPFMSFTLDDAKQFNPTGLNHIKTAKGLMVNQWTLNQPAADVCSIDLDCVGQQVTYASGAALSVTASTVKPYIANNTSWYLPSGTSSKINEVNSSVTRIMNNIVAEPWQNGSNFVTQPYPTNRDYSVELRVDANTNWTKAFYDQYFKGGSSFNLWMQNYATGSKYLQLTFSGCHVTAMDDPSTFSAGQEQTITVTPNSCAGVCRDQIVSYNPW